MECVPEQEAPCSCLVDDLQVDGVAACDERGVMGTCQCIVVAGACATRTDGSRATFSMILLDEAEPMLPATFLPLEMEQVGRRLDPRRIRFDRTPGDRALGVYGPGVATGSDDVAIGTSLGTLGVEYQFTTDRGAGPEPRLVLMLLDQSGSLAGRDPYTDEVDASRASDPLDRRIDFLQALAQRLDPSDLLSLIIFQGDFPHIGEEFATPTRERAPALWWLEQSREDEWNRTPLIHTLGDTRRRVIDPNPALSPVVVLFTDGVEDGDPADFDNRFEEAVDAYVDRPEGRIPVIVVHLQSAPGAAYARGPSARLADLACRTGGEYIFVDRPDGLLADDLMLAVQHAIEGTWRVEVSTSLGEPRFGAGAYGVSTLVQVWLDGVERTVALQSAEAPGAARDTRLWIFKE